MIHDMFKEEAEHDGVVNLNAAVAAACSVSADHHEVPLNIITGVLVNVMEREWRDLSAQRTLPPAMMELL